MIATLSPTQPDIIIPVAAAHLVRGRQNWLWQVRHCPFCGGRHQHGGGRLDGDPRRLLGHRVADCGAAGGYLLREEGGR